MKKRMFITTIVMMLVLAVALTTSSLAWFSSAQTTVTASAATFKASSASSTSVNLKVRQSDEAWGNSIAFTSNDSRVLQPLVPTAPLVASDASVTYAGAVVNGVQMPVKYGDYTYKPTMTFNSATISSEYNTFTIESKTEGNSKIAYSYAPIETLMGDESDLENNYALYEKAGTTGPVPADSAANVKKDGTQSYIYKINYTQRAANDNESQNDVDVFANVGDATAGAYYYETFYLKNASEVNSIAQLQFDVTATLANSGDDLDTVQASAFIAFLIFDEVEIAVPEANDDDNAATQIPLNAQSSNAGKYVVQAGYAGDLGEDKIITTATKVWVPFAAFTFMKHGDNNQDTNHNYWQFADLNYTTPETGFYYNGKAIETGLPTQEADVEMDKDTNIGSFKLNDTSLKGLNNKVSNGLVDVSSGSRDTTSQFEMLAGEIYKIDMYYWLDGLTLTAGSDTTVGTVALTIGGSQTAN